jgi:hypothetical protein
MKLKQNDPTACPSINVAGFEYSPGPDGAVEISNDEHIAVAKENGFAEIDAAGHVVIETTHTEGE